MRLQTEQQRICCSFFVKVWSDVMAEYRYGGSDSMMRMVIGRGYLQTIRRKQGGSPHTDAFSGIQ